MAALQTLDRRILDVLADDGRMANSEVARRLGVSEKTVRQRISRMIEQVGLRFRPEIEASRTGAQVLYLVDTVPGQRLAVADRLARLAPVDSVRLVTGGHDIVVEATFESDAAALEFYVAEVEAGPGVERSLSIHVIKPVSPSDPAAPDERSAAFESLAPTVSTLEELLDLACDVGGREFGTSKVFVGIGGHIGSDGAIDAAQGWTHRWKGLSSRYIDALTHRLATDPVAPAIRARGQHLFIADALTDPMFKSFESLVEGEGFRSFLALPVRSDGESQGVLNLYFDEVVSFDSEQIARAQTFADEIGEHAHRILSSG